MNEHIIKVWFAAGRIFIETDKDNVLSRPLEAFIQEIVDKVSPADYKAYLEELIALKLGLRSK